jgi:peptidoglycan/xylan/chitin deacetylase (PgdA/CDA1 family)|tara:strand:- start:9923 stop:10537 length:615 start_codon:yes stop_codon:yes gene_type:complete
MNLFKTPRYLTWIFPRRTWGFSLEPNTVYLTFDDGPNPILTPWVLDFLSKKQIKATFFCVGQNIVKYPELFDRIKAEGHQIANHSMRHEKGTKTKWKDYKESIDETAKLVENNLFRPPYGRVSMLQSAKLKPQYKIIMWSWLSNDFDEKIPIQKILQKAEKQIKGGQIILLHDNDNFEERVKTLLPKIIEVIQAKGLKFEVISA